MTGTIKRTTTHYNMRIPIFDAPGWGREIERNLDILDAVVFAATNFSLVKGVWANATLYVVGDRVVDEDANTIWECLVQHTSPATGTFKNARVANPTYWQIVSTIAQNRGKWQTGTTYKYNDFVESGNKVAVTVVPSYTSGASFDNDVLNNNLHVVIDLEPQLAAASASAAAAEASATAAQTSKTNAASSASAASVSADNASSSASAAASSASAASVSASNAASSASQAASSKTNAEAAKTAAESARDQAQTYRNEALNFRNQAEGFKNGAEAAAAAAATFDPNNFYTKTAADSLFYTKTAADGLFFPKTGGTITGNLAVGGEFTYDKAKNISGTDLDALTVPGFYDGQTLTNAPNGNSGWFYIEVQRHSNDDTYAFQRATALNHSGNRTWVRIKATGTWGPWRRVWDDANVDVWEMQPIGMPIPIFDHIPGVPIPPIDQSYRYVKLTAGLSGAGGYNQGVLTSESMSGSAPYINATAVVNFAGSPINGQTIRLLNTEGRFLRAGPTSGVLQDDELKAHNHAAITYLAQADFGGWRFAGAPGNPPNAVGNTANTGGAETRPRNIAVPLYMRIK